MADQTFDPQLETLLRSVLTTEVAKLPVTTRPEQILARRNARRRSRLRLLVFGDTMVSLPQLSVAMGAIAVLAMAGALAFATLRLDRTPVAAPLPATPEAWSRVVIDAGPNLQGVGSLVASPGGLLAVVGVDNAPPELFASTDGNSWTRVPPDARPAIGTDGSGWVLTGTDRGFLLSNGDIWFSADGFNWQLLGSRTDSPDLGHGEMLAMAAGGPGYVAVGNGNSAWFSTDGSDWSLAQVPPPPTQFFKSRGYSEPEVAMHRIVVAGDTLVASGTASSEKQNSGLGVPVLWASKDGKNWTSVLEPGDPDEEGPVAGGPGGFVAVQYSFEGARRVGDVVMRYSQDGYTWEKVDSLGPWFTDGEGGSIQVSVESIAASDAGFVAAGSRGPVCLMAGVPCGPNDALIWTSNDGRSWSQLPSDERFAGAGASGVVAWGDRFVMGGSQDDQAMIWISGPAPAGSGAQATHTP